MGQTQSRTLWTLILEHLQDFRDRAISKEFEIKKRVCFLKEKG